MSRQQRAFTLMEVMIATALFVMAAAAVMESLSATRHLNSQAAAKDQIEFESRQILRTMAADLTASGWEFEEDVTYAGVTTGVDRTLRYYPMVQVQRSPGGANTGGFNTAMPWTSLTDAALVLPARPTVLPGDQGDDLLSPAPAGVWQNSFHARSTNLVFLRATVGSWNPDQDPGSASDTSSLRSMSASAYLALRPSQMGRPTLDFSTDANGLPTSWQDWRTADQHDRLGVLHATAFVEDPPLSSTWIERFPNQAYGVTLDGGWYDAEDAEDAPIKPAWESMRKPDISTIPVIAGKTPNEVRRSYMLSPQRYREFMYAVVRSPTTLGLGRLVRAYRQVNAGAIPEGVEPGQRITAVATDAGEIATEQVAMVVDQVLSDDVVRVVFDTYRTVDAGGSEVTALGINQIRVRLFLARRQITNPDNIIRRVIETTLSMRARSSGGDMLNTSASLGATPIGLTR